MNSYYILGIMVVLISSFSQILLKLAANDTNNKSFKTLFNSKVIIAYGILFLMMFVNARFVYKHIEMNSIGIIEAFAYIFIPILSWLFLHEKISKRQLIGVVIILIGIIIFNL